MNVCNYTRAFIYLHRNSRNENKCWLYMFCIVLFTYVYICPSYVIYPWVIIIAGSLPPPHKTLHPLISNVNPTIKKIACNWQNPAPTYTTWFKVSRIRSILQPSYINTSRRISYLSNLSTRKNDKNKNMTVQTKQGTLDMWDCFPRLECFESVCPRPSAPGRSESRNGPRCLLQRPPPGGFQGLGGGALGGGYLHV